LSGVDAVAAAGFAAASDAYERGRPGYPADAVDALVEALAITSASTVVDLAAGTGKLTRALVGRAGTTIAVEPVDEMRARLRDAVPGARALAGTAEAIPLPDAAADAVAVAQAFHWFDGPRALAEIDRVLRPGGGLGLVWNVRDESVGWVARLGQAIHRHDPGVSTHRTGGWRAAFERTAAFGPLAERTFAHPVETTLDGLLDLVRSVSYVASLGEPAREALEAEAAAIAAPHVGADGALTIPYRTRVLWARAAG
jgi:ubiquinone/menaquinone biosynthesis C-methylase UbiE